MAKYRTGRHNTDELIYWSPGEFPSDHDFLRYVVVSGPPAHVVVDALNTKQASDILSRVPGELPYPPQLRKLIVEESDNGDFHGECPCGWWSKCNDVADLACDWMDHECGPHVSKSTVDNEG